MYTETVPILGQAATGQIANYSAQLRNPTTGATIGSAITNVTNPGAFVEYGGNATYGYNYGFTYASYADDTKYLVDILLSGVVVGASMVTPPAEAAASAVGSGADQVTITWTNTSTNLPVADGDVWITTDAAGSNVVAGTLQTNSLGKRMFMLDAGTTYRFWGQKDGVNSVNGEAFVAVAD